MKRFRIHWKDGTSTVVHGDHIGDAVSKAGFDLSSPALAQWEALEDAPEKIALVCGCSVIRKDGQWMMEAPCDTHKPSV